jgi:hypothetical protein
VSALAGLCTDQRDVRHNVDADNMGCCQGVADLLTDQLLSGFSRNARAWDPEEGWRVLHGRLLYGWMDTREDRNVPN